MRSDSVRCRFGGALDSPLIRFENRCSCARFGGVQARDRFGRRGTTLLLRRKPLAFFALLTSVGRVP